MGNTSLPKLNHTDPTQKADLCAQIGATKIYRNKTGKQYEKYQINNEYDQHFQQKYDFRIQSPSTYLVQVYYARPAQNVFGCASNRVFEVVTERIPRRLSDFIILNAQQALYVIYRVFKGCQLLHRSSGIFAVTENMIGINRQNKIKVWLNSNFSSNQKQNQLFSYGSMSPYQQEMMMVDNITELINNKTQSTPYWNKFIEDRYYRKTGFQQAIQLVKAYASLNNVVLEGCFGEKQDKEYWKNGYKSKLTLIQHGKNSQIQQSAIKENRKQLEEPQSANQNRYISPQPSVNRFHSLSKNAQSLEIKTIHNGPTIIKKPILQQRADPHFQQISGIRQKIVRQTQHHQTTLNKPVPTVTYQPSKDRIHSQPQRNTRTASSNSKPKITFNINKPQQTSNNSQIIRAGEYMTNNASTGNFSSVSFKNNNSKFGCEDEQSKIQISQILIPQKSSRFPQPDYSQQNSIQYLESLDPTKHKGLISEALKDKDSEQNIPFAIPPKSFHQISNQPQTLHQSTNSLQKINTVLGNHEQQQEKKQENVLDETIINQINTQHIVNDQRLSDQKVNISINNNYSVRLNTEMGSIEQSNISQSKKESNIVSSKMSVNIGDLKGMVSYKDLRNLLKNTRQRNPM